jgi:hypothetical protein
MAINKVVDLKATFLKTHILSCKKNFHAMLGISTISTKKKL